MTKRVYSAWLLVCPSREVPGQWVGHCLELDVVSQGNSLEHALSMVGEACAMVAIDDLSRGEDPLARRAGEEHYETLYRILKSGERIPIEIAQSDTSGKYTYAIPFELVVEAVETAATASHAKKTSAAKPKKKAAPRRHVEVAFAQQLAAC